MMTTLRRTLLFTSLSLAIPALAAAQSPQSTPSGFAGVMGGLTFGATTSNAIAGNGGIGIAPGLFVFGEFGYMRNVAPREAQDLIDQAVAQLERQYGVPVTIDMVNPQIYTFAGMRWSPSSGRVSPFVEGGVGIGRVSIKVRRYTIGNEDLRKQAQDMVDDEGSGETALLFVVGGGVNAPISKSASVDIGFRYTRLATEDTPISTKMVYAALKFGR